MAPDRRNSGIEGAPQRNPCGQLTCRQGSQSRSSRWEASVGARLPLSSAKGNTEASPEFVDALPGMSAVDREPKSDEPSVIKTRLCCVRVVGWLIDWASPAETHLRPSRFACHEPSWRLRSAIWLCPQVLSASDATPPGSRRRHALGAPPGCVRGMSTASSAGVLPSSTGLLLWRRPQEAVLTRLNRPIAGRRSAFGSCSAGARSANWRTSTSGVLRRHAKAPSIAAASFRSPRPR